MHALCKRRELPSIGGPVSAASMHLELAYQRDLSIRIFCPCCDAADEPHMLCRHHKRALVQKHGQVKAHGCKCGTDLGLACQGGLFNKKGFLL